ncbi:hypothetical protein E4U41_006093 [Claviceps citrina]|nr:hypothetical protein E4U41_006093 [Claviceps citrina]
MHLQEEPPPSSPKTAARVGNRRVFSQGKRSAVQLKHIPTGIVVKSQATRSRSQNRKAARELLAQKIDNLLNGEQSRSSIVGEVKRKKAASALKKSRRKYRQLEQDKAVASTPVVQESTMAPPHDDEAQLSSSCESHGPESSTLQLEPDRVRGDVE